MCSKGYTTLSFIINYNTYFRLAPFFFHISQGSVATCLRRGGIFKYKFVANLLPSLPVKKFENRFIFGEVMGRVWCLVFFDSRCSLEPIIVQCNL